jgi:hypothetical protein
MTSALIVTMIVSVAPVWSQATAATASEFYMQYRKVFDAATKVEEILPYMSAATVKEVQATPAAERPEMFKMIKMMGALTNVKVVKEARTANGATLTVEAVDPDKAATIGTITIVREGNAFKVDRESWSSK